MKEYCHEFIYLAFATKFLAYLSVKILYPLAPFLEEEWNISRDDFATILAVTEIASIPALLIAPLADKFNAKIFLVMAWIVATLTILLLSIDLAPQAVEDMSNLTENRESNRTSFAFVLTNRIFFAFSVQVFVITNLSVILKVSKEGYKEASAGIVEYSWALSALVGIPFLSLIYGSLGVFWTFFLLGTVMIGYAVHLVWFFCRQRLTKHNISSFFIANLRKISSSSIGQVACSSPFVPNFKSFADALKDICQTNFILLCLQVFCLMITYNALFTVLSFWFSDEFDISVEETGATFFVIGSGEIAGAVVYSCFAAKLKEQLFYLAYALSAVLLLAVIWLSFVSEQATALVALFFIFCPFELITILTIVAAASVVSESHKNLAISIHAGMRSLGRAIGAFFGEEVYSSQGFRSALTLLAIPIVISTLLLVAAKCVTKTQRSESKQMMKDINLDEVKKIDRELDLS